MPSNKLGVHIGQRPDGKAIILPYGPHCEDPGMGRPMAGVVLGQQADGSTIVGHFPNRSDDEGKLVPDYPYLGPIIGQTPQGVPIVAVNSIQCYDNKYSSVAKQLCQDCVAMAANWRIVTSFTDANKLFYDVAQAKTVCPMVLHQRTDQRDDYYAMHCYGYNPTCGHPINSDAVLKINSSIERIAQGTFNPTFNFTAAWNATFNRFIFTRTGFAPQSNEITHKEYVYSYTLAGDCSCQQCYKQFVNYKIETYASVDCGGIALWIQEGKPSTTGFDDFVCTGGGPTYCGDGLFNKVTWITRRPTSGAYYRWESFDCAGPCVAKFRNLIWGPSWTQDYVNWPETLTMEPA